MACSHSNYDDRIQDTATEIRTWRVCLDCGATFDCESERKPKVEDD